MSATRAVKRFLRRFRWHGKSFIISALTGEGCRELVFAVMKHLDAGLGSRGAPGAAKSRGAGQRSLNPGS